MRHYDRNDHLSRSYAQRKALIRSMIRNLILHERVKTTPRKAKALASAIARVIIWAKKGTLHHQRLIYKVIPDHALVQQICKDIAMRYKDISSGFTRIIRTGTRKGDGAELAFIELTKREIKKKPISAVKAQGENQDVKTTEERSKSSQPLKSGIKGIFRRKAAKNG